jgi:hypothetical protein
MGRRRSWAPDVVMSLVRPSGIEPAASWFEARRNLDYPEQRAALDVFLHQMRLIAATTAS